MTVRVISRLHKRDEQLIRERNKQWLKRNRSAPWAAVSRPGNDRALLIDELDRVRGELKKLKKRLDDTKICNISFISVRAEHALKNAGILTVGDLREKTLGDLLRIKNFSRKCLKNIEEALETAGHTPLFSDTEQ